MRRSGFENMEGWRIALTVLPGFTISPNLTFSGLCNMDSFKRIMLRNGLSLRITFLISLTRDPRTPWLQSKLQCERGQQFESNHICRLFNHHPPITREDSSTRPPIPPISESIYLKSSSAPWLCLGTYLCTTATIY